MYITALDHLVLTVCDIEVTCQWYQSALGMERVIFGADRIALQFGSQKINLHEAGKEFEPKAARPTPGSADLCFLTDVPLKQVQAHLASQQVSIVEGPVVRTGASSLLLSLYIRDPDGNLIEVSNLTSESSDFR